jgi:hypothetical protein
MVAPTSAISALASPPGLVVIVISRVLIRSTALSDPHENGSLQAHRDVTTPTPEGP